MDRSERLSLASLALAIIMTCVYIRVCSYTCLSTARRQGLQRAAGRGPRVVHRRLQRPPQQPPWLSKVTVARTSRTRLARYGRAAERATKLLLVLLLLLPRAVQADGVAGESVE